MIEENESLRTNLDELQTDLTEISNEKEVYKKQLKDFKRDENKKSLDKSDQMEILKHTLANKISENDGIRKELETAYVEQAKLSQQFKCELCDYRSEIEDDLKYHNEKMHESKNDDASTSNCGTKQEVNASNVNELEENPEVHKCDICDFRCKTKTKLDSHMCRMLIENPASTDLYLNNLIIPNGCTTLFSKRANNEIAILHSQDCLQRKNVCSDLPTWYPFEDQKYDGVVWHIEIDKYLLDRTVNWQALNKAFGR